MRGYMFKNRWMALLFVAMTVLGALNLVGGEDGVLMRAGGDLEARQAASDASRFGPPPEYLAPAQDAGPIVGGDFEFSEEEDLIDEAMGFDPSPDVDPEPAADEDEVAILPADVETENAD